MKAGSQRWLLATGIFLSVLSVSANAGRIVVNHDEWTWSETGFSNAGSTNTTNFAQNVAEFLDSDGSSSGTVLIYSNNFGLTGTSFLAALIAEGYTPTVSTVIPFDLPTLSTFDAVFLGGNPFGKDDTVLTAYTNAGGGVYIAAGTGVGGAAAEALRWNGFLSGFGLAFDGGSYNGISGTLPVASSHPIFAGVAQLYFNNGNTVLDIGDPNSQIVLTNAAGAGLIGVFDNLQVTPVPEPASLALLGLGLAGLAGLRRRLPT